MEKDITSLICKAHKAPGYRYLHFDDEHVLFDVLDGLEDIGKAIPVSVRTSFNAFSTTKTVTSAVVLKLVQDGTIALDNSAKDYLPDYSLPDQVTIKHLLSHQSGISNPIPLKWIHLKEEHTQFNSTDFADHLLKTTMKFRRNPGSKFSYSNLNYLLLGRLIEEVTKQPYEKYVANTILKVVNEKGSLMRFDYPESNHATGSHTNNWFQRLLLKWLINKEGLFQKENSKWLSLHPFYVNGIAYGGLFSHPESMMRYCRLLMPGNETFLSESVKNGIYNEHLAENGQNTGMSLGWFVGQLKGHKYICHAGGGAGYYTEIRMYPDLGKGSVIMFNSSGMSDKRVLDTIDKQLI